MKILIVGCGAVGQVFGLFLQKAGLELGFYARPDSAERLERALGEGGLPLFQTSHFHRREPIAHRLNDYQLVTDMAGSKLFKPDQIWFTTPSTVYYTPWYQAFLREVPSERVVCFAPEGGRPPFYPQNGDADRMVFGGVTFIAWQGDLDGGGGRPEAVNFWLPPLIQIPLMGTEQACSEVGMVLKQAGFRTSSKKENFHGAQSAATGLLSTFVAGFELSGWSFWAYRNSPWLQQAARASREAVLSQFSEPGIFTRRFLAVLPFSMVFHLVTRFLPFIFPFNLEKYLKFHYKKTRDQTLSLLDIFIKDGKSRGVLVGNIQTLLKGLHDSV